MSDSVALNQSSVALTETATTDATTPRQPSMIESLLPFVLIMAVFYFMIIRPQSKKIKEHQQQLSQIAKGTEVITSGGILGKVTKVQDEEGIIHVEIADKVVVRVKKETVSEVISKK